MKEISIKIDDELYRRATRKVENLEAEVNQLVAEYLHSVGCATRRVEDLKAEVSQYVTEYLESVDRDEDVVAARTRMADLFATTKAFGVGIRPSREEMHDR
jgi:hypothetical protein